MKPWQDEAGEQPKKLATYTIKLDDAQLEKLRAVCEARGWEPFDVAYARFAFRGPEVNVTAYDKRGMVVIAGKGTEDFVLHMLETEVTGAPRLGYDEVLHPERFEAHAGLDESGKGDFFGPVIAATVIAEKPAIDAWLKAGVKDSKRLSDPQILKLDGLIRKTSGAVAKTCFCGMPKYNELMMRPGANLNRLLAWQHATALNLALNEKWVPWGLLDQFSEQPLTQRELAKKNVRNFELKMRPRAEEDPGGRGCLGCGARRIRPRNEASVAAVRRSAAKRRGREGQGAGGADHPEIRRRRAGRFRQAPLPHRLRSRGRRGETRRAPAAETEGTGGMEAGPTCTRNGSRVACRMRLTRGSEARRRRLSSSSSSALGTTRSTIETQPEERPA